MVRRNKSTARAPRRGVIFDFDGTIADSFEYVFDFLRGEADNTDDFSVAEKRKMRAMSMKRLALHLGVPFWRLPFVYFKGRRVMRAHMERVLPFIGMIEAVRELHAQGWRLYVASSNSTHNIRHLLKRYHIEGYFKAVRGSAGFWGKTPLIRGLVLRYRLRKAETWYVGDEAGDISAATRAGVRALAVGWGFANPADLKAMKPAAFAETPADLVKVLGSAWKK